MSGGEIKGSFDDRERRRSMPLNSSMEGTARVVEGRKANTGDEKAKKKGSLFFEVKKVVPGERRMKGYAHVDLWNEDGSDDGDDQKEEGKEGDPGRDKEGENWSRYIKMVCDSTTDTDHISVTMVVNGKETGLWQGEWEAMRKYSTDIGESWEVHKAMIVPRRMDQLADRRDPSLSKRRRGSEFAMIEQSQAHVASLKALRELPADAIREFVGLKTELDAAREGKSRGLHPKDGRAVMMRTSKNGYALKTMRGLVFKSRLLEPAARAPTLPVNANHIQWQLSSHAQLRTPPAVRAVHAHGFQKLKRLPSPRTAERMQRDLRPLDDDVARPPQPSATFSSTGLLTGQVSPHPPRTPRSWDRRRKPDALQSKASDEHELHVPIHVEEPHDSVPSRVRTPEEVRQMAEAIRRKHLASVVVVGPFAKSETAETAIQELPALPVRRTNSDASGTEPSLTHSPRTRKAGGKTKSLNQASKAEEMSELLRARLSSVKAVIKSRKEEEEQKMRASDSLATQLLEVLGQPLEQPWRHSTEATDLTRCVSVTPALPWNPNTDVVERNLHGARLALPPVLGEGEGKVNLLSPMPEDLELSWAHNGRLGRGGHWRQQIGREPLHEPPHVEREPPHVDPASACLPSGLLMEVLKSRAEDKAFAETAFRFSMERGKLGIARGLNVLQGLPAGAMTERIRREHSDATSPSFSLAQASRGSVTHR